MTFDGKKVTNRELVGLLLSAEGRVSFESNGPAADTFNVTRVAKFTTKKDK